MEGFFAVVFFLAVVAVVIAVVIVGAIVAIINAFTTQKGKMQLPNRRQT